MLVHLVSRYGSRFRRAWRAFWFDSENAAERIVKPDSEIARKSQSTSNNNTRNAIIADDGVVNSSKSDVNDALMDSRCHDPVGESDLTTERVNNFGMLRGGQIFFR